MGYLRAWDGAEWQKYCVKLIQKRHNSSNVQLIPDKVKGDAGIECFSLDGCVYQCYAPEEVSDIAKAASAMKKKGRTDLRKLEKNDSVLTGLLNGVLIHRWILVCPFLDDKAVVSDLRQYGAGFKSKAIGFLANDFEVLVQCQEDFHAEIEYYNSLSLGPPLKISAPTGDEIEKAKENPLNARLDDKLNRAFSGTLSFAEIEKRKSAFIRSHAIRENALSKLKETHPELWDRVVQCLSAEEDRLNAFGSSSDIPAQQLKESVAKIEESLKHDLPSLAGSSITQIANGTISDWLLRCPLDFPDKKGAADGISI